MTLVLSTEHLNICRIFIGILNFDSSLFFVGNHQSHRSPSRKSNPCRFVISEKRRIREHRLDYHFISSCSPVSPCAMRLFIHRFPCTFVPCQYHRDLQESRIVHGFFFFLIRFKHHRNEHQSSRRPSGHANRNHDGNQPRRTT